MATIFLALLTQLTGCGDHQGGEEGRIEPTFIYVELLEESTGTEEAPLAFTSEPVELQVRVTTLDIDGNPYTAFNGDLTLDIRPGDVEQDPKVTLADGVYEGPITITNGFGPTRVWFSDLGDKDIDSERPISFATGVSEPIYYHFPTVGEMNRIDDHETNQLDGEFAELRVDDRDVRVSHVAADGFWVRDLDDPEGGYNSLFVYTFSAPDDAIQLGRRLTQLNGNNQEYLATTQFSFPDYKVGDDDAVEMPAPALLEWSSCGDSDFLEGYEGTVVRLEGARIPSSFVSGSEEYEDYLSYGQWPVESVSDQGSSCNFFVENSTSVPYFYPTEFVGQELDYVQGMLIEIWGTWILLIRDEEDLPASFRPSDSGDSAARKTHRPVPRPRK
jgi:hypothetical protein